MVFSSTAFLFVFLPVVLLTTWASPVRFRRFVLLAASAVFYWYGVQEFLLLIYASTLADWGLGLLIARKRAAGEDRAAKWLLTLAVAQGLSLLLVYKYAGFFTRNLDDLGDILGHGSVPLVTIALPLGVSFFTFEKISYVVDIYRGHVQPRRDPLDVLLFVSLFPRSIAGPIVRLREVEGQLRRPSPSLDDVADGAVRFSWGLAKKVMIADQIAPACDAAFAAGSNGDLTSVSAWVGAWAFSAQIYFDFSGYADMALGLGQMLGFRFPENFDRPYSSWSVTDFWRRWNLTLSRWFRDYVFISMGGNRHGTSRTAFNLVLVFVLAGFWHGAAWNFVLWGLYHGVWLLIERVFGFRAVDEKPRLPVLRHAVTVVILVTGSVLFRSPSIGFAWDYFKAMWSFTGGVPEAMSLALDNVTVAALVLAFATVFLPRDFGAVGKRLAEGRRDAFSRSRVLVMAGVLPAALIIAMTSSYTPFLYFRF